MTGSIPILLTGIALAVPGALPDTVFVDAGVSSSVVKIGERVLVDISVALPDSGFHLIGPPAPLEIGPVDIVTSGPRPTAPDSAGWQLEIALFEPGELDLSGVPFVLEGSTRVVPVRIRPYRISVVSSLPETLTTAEIRDIKNPLPAPVRWRWSRIVGAAVLVLLALAGFLLWRRRRTREITPIKPYLPEHPPEVIALRALRELEEEALPERGLIKEHYSRLSLILRRYMEARLRVPAVESTTEEIRAALTTVPLPATADEMILDLFARADMVKFAKARPEVSDAGVALGEGRRWVELLTPRREPVGEAS